MMKISTTLRLASTQSVLKGLFIAAGFVFATGQSVNGQATSPPSGVCTVNHQFSNTNHCINDWSFSSVGLNGWKHNVNCNTSAPYRYWNNLGSVTTLSPGGVYTVEMTTLSTIYQMGRGAWIDYNHDGTFSANEYLGTGSTTIGNSTTQFTVPCNAVAGPTLIRFRCDYFRAFTASFGCGNSSYGYGETMDYIINIASTSTPSANFSIPDTVYQNSPALFVNNNQVGYVSHEWDLLNQGGSPDAISVNYTGLFNNLGTYQLRLSSTNCQGTATTTKSFDVVAPTSSPAANYVVSENSIVYDGTNPIFVDFFDLTLYGPTAWEWTMTPDWLNGAPYIWTTNNFSQNPSAFFYDYETYDVCLIVSNSLGVDTLCRYGYIEITTPGAGATFENVLGQNAGSNLDSGYIYDSGGDKDPYGSNEYFEFVIEPCGASDITLHFHDFDVVAGDNLKVYDGTSTNGTLLGTFTGNTVPADVKGTSGKLFLVWTSNGTGTAAGFKASWTSTIVANGQATANFTIADTVYACSGGNDVEFLNSSTGVVEGQASYDWIFDFDPNVTYPTGYADAKDEENPTWSYSANGTYNVRMVLKSCEGNDTIEKTFVIANTSSNPIVDFTTTNRILKVNETSFFKASAIAACSYEWEITPTTYSIENGGTSTDNEITVKFTAPGSYNVKLIATNDNGSSYKERTNHVEVIDYCRPTTQYPTVADVGIINVEMGDIMNESGSGIAPGYSDYTATMGTSVLLGETYSYTVERPSKVNNVNFKIWIDFNRDGEFTEPAELVASEVNSAAASFTGNIEIPGLADVIRGESRMRVGMGLANTNLLPCGPNQVGEYEDYTIMLTLDDMRPVITMIGGDTVIEKNTSYVDPGATATDNIEGNITPRMDTHINLDTAQAGIYFVTYNVTDLSGNIAIEVIRQVQVVDDLTKPTIVLNGASPLLWSVKVPFQDPGFVATDMPSGANIDNLVQVSDNVDVDMIGDYTVTFTVQDAYGNETTETRTVQVRDTTAPSLVGNATMPIQVGVSFVDPITATDNYDMNVQPMKVSGFVNSMVIGEYTMTYSVEDASGNKGANLTVKYEVEDYIAPTIIYSPGTQTVVVDVFNTNWENAPGLNVGVSDNYYPTANLTRTPQAGFDINTVGTYTITYEATDKSGNSSTFVRTVQVVDREKPVVLTTSVNLPRWTTYDFTTGVVVADNYYQPVDFRDGQNGCSVEIIRSNVDFNYPGVYQVTYVATDGSGNMSEETTRLVQIGENSINTGIDAIDLEKAINVYPNPNKGQFTIKLDASLGLNGADVVIVDMLGNRVYAANASAFANAELNIDLAHVSAGVYMVQVSSELGATSKRVVIN